MLKRIVQRTICPSQFRSSVENIAGIIQQVDVTQDILRIPRVEPDNGLHTTVCLHIDEQRVIHHVPGDLLRAWRRGQRAAVLRHIGPSDVTDQCVKVQPRRQRRGPRLGDLFDVLEDAAQERGRDVCSPGDFDNEADNSD